VTAPKACRTRPVVLAHAIARRPSSSIGGSVAVGKSTTARILRELLKRWPSAPEVDLVTTDGFLLPNAVLAAEGLMERKGFPESYDVGTLLSFLTDIKAGKPHVTAPVYSHLTYDIVPGETISVDRPDILILEGLNVLQPRDLPKHGKAVPFVSDFFDFSLYIDADEEDVRGWYIERFMRLKETRFHDPRSYFHRYASLSADEAKAVATGLWERINLVNLRDNILPTRPARRSDPAQGVRPQRCRSGFKEALRPELRPRDNRDRVIVALDLPNLEAARHLVGRLGDAASFYKVGMQLVFAGGLRLVEDLRSAGKRVFLDMKLLDIDNTIESAVASIAGLGVTFTTIHAYPTAMRAAARARLSDGPGLLAVTVLTSMDDADLRQAGYARTAAELVPARGRRRLRGRHGRGRLLAVGDRCRARHSRA
jgi:pantothenate kinase